MTYNEFKNLESNQTVEDSHGVIGYVKSIDHSQEVVWVKFEDEDEVLWIHYSEIEMY